MSDLLSVVADCPLKWSLSAQVKADPEKCPAGSPGPGKVRISIADREDESGTIVLRHALAGKSGESPVECLLTGHEAMSYYVSAQAENGHWVGKKAVQVSVAPGHPQTVSLELDFRAIPHGIIDSSNADLLLERGDVLIKFAAQDSTFTEKVIMAGEKAVKKLSGLFFRVYRSQDRALAEAAAKVAETWATGRMKYLVPALVPFHLASFGPQAHGEALVFGQESGRKGGPLRFEAMFCSQFVIAVYQAAAVAKQLRQEPGMISTDVQMPAGLDLHASNSSPLAFHARLEGASATWRYVDEVLVRPQQDANAQTAPRARPGKDVTEQVQVLGNPTQKRWPSGEWIYARNPWSLEAFEGKIYVGSGNSNNPPPAANAGPVDLWALDAATGTFPEKAEYEVPDEQVDVFRILSDGLWIPGHDSKVTARNDSRVKGERKYEQFKRLLKTAVTFPADWAAGNVHHKIGSQWMTMNNIPNGIHVYDVIDFGGALFAAIATVMGGMVARSNDRGHTWEVMLTKPFPYSRTRTFFVLDDDTGPRLYASTNGGRIYRFDGRSDFAEMAVRFFPGISDLKEVFAARPTEFRKQVA